MVAAQQQDALLASCMPISEATHHRRAGVEVAPTLEVGDRDVQLLAHRLEQVAQVELLGCDLDIDVEVVPHADRQVAFVGVIDEVIEQALGLVGEV